MPESISINFVGREVGVQYHAETLEATFRDEMLAREIALQVLASQAIEHRRQHGMQIPAALVAVLEANTYRELL